MFYIEKRAWDKIIGYAECAYDTHKSEIGGMAVVVRDKDDDWEIKHPVILKQEISSGNCELDKDALADYYTRAAKKIGKKADFRFCWWHSHHTMGAFWSSTDLKAIDEFNEGDFSFALVVNLKEEYKFRVSVWQPFEMHSDEELEILGRKRITKTIAKDVEKHCTKETLYSWHRNKKPLKKSDKQTDLQLPLSHTYTRSAYYNNYNRENKYITYNDLHDDVDAIVSEVIDGTLEYKDYTSAIDALNKKLEEAESSYRVTTIPESRTAELLTSLPHDFIVYKSTNEKVYDTDNDFHIHGWGY
jgi:hypothetical protein